MCLSGEVHDLSPAQWKLTVSAMELYRRVYPIIRDGESFFHGETGKSWRHPRGWQGVVRLDRSRKRALVVIHGFARPFPQELSIEIPGTGWKIEEVWPPESAHKPRLSRGRLQVSLPGAFSAVVVQLRSGASRSA
jgi:alpha-galactosidase